MAEKDGVLRSCLNCIFVFFQTFDKGQNSFKVSNTYRFHDKRRHQKEDDLVILAYKKDDSL
jgi:hypothetical protein